METDLSRLLYDKYFSLTKREIEIRLKNGKVFRGVIIGFHKNNDDEIPYVQQWHIVETKDKSTFGIDAFGFLIGQIINQKDISEVMFFQDNTILKFE